jgi:RNA polymerase sigma factor (sigma-70 family)
MEKDTLMSQLIQKEVLSPLSMNAYTTPEAMLAGERRRLIRLCARLTGNVDAAEDLAQETLLEAWRNLHKLYDHEDAESRAKWLSAIARNMCMRWMRCRSHDRAHLVTLNADADEGETGIEDVAADEYDLEIELERDELAHLLDRALAYLPPPTRDVLIERYIHESPHAEIAERLGLSEDALVQRLHRGKLALRRVITTNMSEEATAYGFSAPVEENARQETRIWCPMCATCRLIKYVDQATNTTCFTCANCGQIAGHGEPQTFAGIHSPKSILNRQLHWLGDYYWQAINEQQATCPLCGRATCARIYRLQDIPPRLFQDIPPGPLRVGLLSLLSPYGIHIFCSSCHYDESNPLSHLILDRFEVQHFWRKHSRMQWLPPQEIEYDDQPAILSSFQSPGEQARIDVISQRATLKVLNVFEHSH